MADYKNLYLTMMRETEKAIRILIEAQRACEEMYMQDGGPAVFSEQRAGTDVEPPRREA